MRTTNLLAGISTGLVCLAAVVTVRRYRRDMRAASARLAAVDRRSISTSFGDIEYAEHGSGEPLLVIHGIFGGCDSGLLFHEMAPGHRVIAPSRFGYLGSAIPPNATPAAQSDAFVALLDALGIEKAGVIGVSAGATSALQLVLRHPSRVRYLVLMSANLPGSTTAVVQPSWARFVNRQFPIWAIKALAPRVMERLAGVPTELPRTEDSQGEINDFLDTMFPISAKEQGVDFDALVSNADVNGYDLEAIDVPTLIVHAKDDPLVRYEGASRAADRIRGARLVSLESGGHLQVGQSETVRKELAAFLRRRPARRRP